MTDKATMFKTNFLYSSNSKEVIYSLKHPLGRNVGTLESRSDLNLMFPDCMLSSTFG